MPAWAVTILLKVLLPAALNLAEKYGVLSPFKADALNLAVRLDAAARTIKTYHNPNDFPDPPPGANASNIGVEQP